MFDQIAYAVKQDGRTGWPLGHDGACAPAHDLPTAAAQARRAAETGAYIDVHVWRFVPASFQLVLADLRAIGAVRLGIETMQVSEEIVAVLSRTAPSATHDRLALMREMNEDEALQALRSRIERQNAERADSHAATLAHERAAAEAQVDALRARIAALETSTSWRLTAPLRALRRILGAR